MRLLAKFSAIYLTVFGLGLGASASLFYGLLQRNAREEVLYSARLLAETALAIRKYTEHEVAPAITSAMGRQRAEATSSHSDDVFHELCARRGFVGSKHVFYPQLVPAHSASSLFDELRKAYPDYTYKEAARNPTSLRNRAVDWEEDIFDQFARNPGTRFFQGERDTPFGRTLFIATPLFADKSCLECHSTPSAAPPEMVRMYGTSNGFGWKDGEMIATRIVSVPLSVPVGMAQRAFRQIVVSIGLVGVVTLILLDLLLYVAVIRPVGVLAARADDISKGQLDVPELPARGRDEIAVLAAAFNRMHRSVTAAMRMLELEHEQEEPPREPPGEAGPEEERT
jgi:protein-histidine pros-kinase